MAFSSPGRIRVSPDILFQELDDEAVLLNLVDDQYYGLDDIGTRMWQLLEAHGEVETVISHLLAEYDVEEAVLRQDLAELIEQLTAANLVWAEASP